MNNGYQKSNGCGADKEGGKIFNTFFYPELQSKHVCPIAYNITDPEYVIVHPDTWIQIYIDLTNVKNDNKNKIPPFKYNGLMVLRTFDIDEETIIIK